MSRIPEEVYVFNMGCNRRGQSMYRPCCHRPWYKWWVKPHYRTINRLSRADKAEIKRQKSDLKQNPFTSSDLAEVRASTPVTRRSQNAIRPFDSASAGDPFSTPTTRRVRIVEAVEHIINTSEESGIDSTFTSTPSRTRRASDGLHDYELIEDSNERNIVPRLNLLLKPDRGPPQRDSFVSMEYHSAASSLSDDYSPSVATASQKSLYFSVSSEKDVVLQVWQPEGDV